MHLPDDGSEEATATATHKQSAELSYLVSRLGWAEQRAEQYQQDYELMLVERNALHAELTRAEGSLRAYRAENAKLKRKNAPGLRRFAKRLRRGTGESGTRDSADPRAEFSSPTPAQPGRGKPYPVPPRTLSPAYVPDLNLVMVVADSEAHISAVEHVTRLGRDAVVLLRPGYPWDTGRYFGYPRRFCSQDPAGRTLVYSAEADLRAENPYHFLDRAADAIVHEARLRRPSVLLADGEAATCRATWIAGRRLGIPVGFVPGQHLLDNMTPDVHFQTLKPAAVPETVPSLAELRVGIICDEFTTRLLSNTLSTTAVDASHWQDQLASDRWDVLLVESAWLGNEGHWKVADYYKDQKGFENLARLVADCRSRNIPTVFWNKEDPVHYRRFRRVAALFDHIVSTDSGSLHFYQANPDAKAQTHSSMTFFADPVLHNPLPTNDGLREKAVAYAGTYYGDRFPDRSAQMTRLFEASEPFGPVIFDRHSNEPTADKAFPAELQQWIRGGLTYAEILDAYKAFPVHLNFNSAPWSETMFSRRVVEIAASGTVVYSAEGRALGSSLGSAFPSSGDKDVYRTHLETWMAQEAVRKTSAWQQMRTVYRAHLSGHALAVLFRTLGIAVAAPQLPRVAMRLPDMTTAVAQMLTAQSVRPALVLAERIEESAKRLVASRGIAVITDPGTTERLSECGVEWIATLHTDIGPTVLEDLLIGTAFGKWSTIRIVRDEPDADWSPLATTPPERDRSLRIATLQRLGDDYDHEPELVLIYPGEDVSGM